jgi:peptidyl-prolyl cis-trans isomerase D
MFDFVRSHTRLLQGLMVLLIFPSFVFFGVQGYSQFTDKQRLRRGQGRRPQHHARRVGRAHQRRSSACASRCLGVDVRSCSTRPNARADAGGPGARTVLLAPQPPQKDAPDTQRRALQRLFTTDPQLCALCATPMAASTGPAGRRA